jgi:UDP-3-O-[3-hydroxymyristoyl] glucosamine N-acyltransferase
VAGAEVVIFPGARIGQEGFGFVATPEGRYVTMPQLGRVVLGDRVEVGANSCIDRGALGDTVLGPGCRLDNLVQIGHNVRAGRGCVFVAHVGVAGSVTLGDFVQVGGQAGIAGHVSVGDRVRIAAQSGVMTDVPPGQSMAGSPALPAKESFRAVAALRRLAARHDVKQG